MFYEVGCFGCNSVFCCVTRFYTECFGMKVLRKRDFLEEKFSTAVLGLGPEESHFVAELVYCKFSVRWVFRCFRNSIIVFVFIISRP